MTERLIEANGVVLCTETFGRPQDPPVLLIMGAMAAMTRWEDEFCERLAAHGRFVIRYDHRDTGRSTDYPVGEPTYTILDFVEDARAVLDAHDVASAHVVGMSLGGMIGQGLALRHPDRVRSLVALMTMPWGIELEDVTVGTEEFETHFGRLEGLDWSDADAAAGWISEMWRLLAGTAHPFDAARSRALAEIDVARARTAESFLNHAAMENAPFPEDKIEDLDVPLLVIHGTGDTLIPFAYAEAFIEARPAAELIALPGVGHEVHADDWDVLIEAIVGHSAPA